MDDLREEDLIHDWNSGEQRPYLLVPPRLVDHTLSCARLSAYLKVPNLDGQRTILELLGRLGLAHICLGSWCDSQVRILAEDCPAMEIQPWVEVPPGRIPPPSLGAYLSHRQKNWPDRARELGPHSVLVIQDATRRNPGEIIELLMFLPGTPISGVCLSDDAGRATPAGAARLVQFVQRALERLDLSLGIEWSGRNDRGLALASALAAWRAGATTLHSSFFSLGEGCGVVATEQLLVNLSLTGSLSRDFSALSEVSRSLAELLQLEVYPNLPVIGIDAFRTGTGVHAAAIMKAQKKGHSWLADLIYSGVPAAHFGFRQIIEVGPMAGASNVHYWLEQHGLEPVPELVQAILDQAKSSQKVLDDTELQAIVAQHREGVTR
jgi:2-isopropylmalate synthase